MPFGKRILSFKFLHATLQESPPQPGELSGVASVQFGGRATITGMLDAYSQPPQDFAVNECVQTLGDLFLLTKERPRIVLYIAYRMITLIKTDNGGIRNAAIKLGMTQGVLNKLKELANRRGIGVEARKHELHQERTPLTSGEREWLMRKMKQIVCQAGKAVAGASLGEQITLGADPVPHLGPQS
jgi:hypothetical protein